MILIVFKEIIDYIIKIIYINLKNKIMNNNRPPLFVNPSKDTNKYQNEYGPQYAHQLYQHYNYQRQLYNYNMYLNNFNIENIQKKSTFITCKNLELNYDYFTQATNN
jgi:hypothetical protein